jgi:uncharacterized Tic20 family protein
MEENTTPPPPANQPPASPPPSAPAATGEVSKDARTMGMLAHILGGFFCFLPPLLIWLIKKDESEFIATEAKEALNFQLTLCILYVILTFTFVLAIFTPLVWLFSIIFGIIGGMKANDGVAYRYPFALRLIK